MLSIVASEGFEAQILEWVSWAALVIELLAISIIFGVTIFGTIQYGLRRFSSLSPGPTGSLQDYERYKHQIGRALLLGLEILVAADIVRTVALDPTLESVAVLGILVLIRTFLTWSLVVEIEGRWPWQRYGSARPPEAAASASVVAADQPESAESRRT